MNNKRGGSGDGVDKLLQLVQNPEGGAKTGGGGGGEDDGLDEAVQKILEVADDLSEGDSFAMLILLHAAMDGVIERLGEEE